MQFTALKVNEIAFHHLEAIDIGGECWKFHELFTLIFFFLI